MKIKLGENCKFASSRRWIDIYEKNDADESCPGDQSFHMPEDIARVIVRAVKGIYDRDPDITPGRYDVTEKDKSIEFK